MSQQVIDRESPPAASGAAPAHGSRRLAALRQEGERYASNVDKVIDENLSKFSQAFVASVRQDGGQ
ncbi:MAG: hypothetical protein HY721_06650 [Planctomycetes bacterium]|nr:hypothetical protein [Planctomycetota bacterium]